MSERHNVIIGVVNSTAKFGRKLVSRIHLLTVTAVLVFALVSPLVGSANVAHADTNCSPNGIMTGGSGSSWLNGGGVNVCNNGSSYSDDYGHNCVYVPGAAASSYCSANYVYSGEEWQCVELVN